MESTGEKHRGATTHSDPYSAWMSAERLRRGLRAPVPKDFDNSQSILRQCGHAVGRVLGCCFDKIAANFSEADLPRSLGYRRLQPNSDMRQAGDWPIHVTEGPLKADKIRLPG